MASVFCLDLRRIPQVVVSPPMTQIQCQLFSWEGYDRRNEYLVKEMCLTPQFGTMALCCLKTYSFRDKCLLVAPAP